MFAAAARIARGAEVPVTIDAEAGYGMEPGDLVGALRTVGAAGCNLEDTGHADGSLRDPDRHAEWLGAVRRAFGVARVSWALYLYRDAMARFTEQLASLTA
jgi:2-methylisocitrate lyase-like PEP mutase family enzyme